MDDKLHYLLININILGVHKKIKKNDGRYVSWRNTSVVGQGAGGRQRNISKNCVKFVFLFYFFFLLFYFFLFYLFVFFLFFVFCFVLFFAAKTACVRYVTTVALPNCCSSSCKLILLCIKRPSRLRMRNLSVRDQIDLTDLS